MRHLIDLAMAALFLADLVWDFLGPLWLPVVIAMFIAAAVGSEKAIRARGGEDA
ncbi:MAG TPA: hypothetical protein PKE45_12385 [Caldilineaceae bacterium]|nr:hypothetical protein [Caldilineaceae bacterium]